MKYGMAELKVPAVVTPQANKSAATSSLTTFGVLMQTVDIISGQSQMLQQTSCP